eukprot:6471318-Amphidinium_carterae.1
MSRTKQSEVAASRAYNSEGSTDARSTFALDSGKLAFAGPMEWATVVDSPASSAKPAGCVIVVLPYSPKFAKSRTRPRSPLPLGNSTQRGRPGGACNLVQ